MNPDIKLTENTIEEPRKTYGKLGLAYIILLLTFAGFIFLDSHTHHTWIFWKNLILGLMDIISVNNI